MDKRFKHGDGAAGEKYLYRTWCGIKRRCSNKASLGYKYWGGRGIKVCDPWKESYIAFKEWILDNLGERPDGYSLDRIENDGDYEPNNLRWATMTEQRINQRRRSDSSSEYTGVSFDKDKALWRAYINYKGSRTYIGFFASKHWAVFSRNRHIVENGLPHKIQQIKNG